MPEYIELEREPSIAERFLGGWRVTVSAWVMAVAFVLLFAGVQALASHHEASPARATLAGAVIPRHDPTCAGAGAETASAPTTCHFDADSIAAAAAEGEAAYGW